MGMGLDMKTERVFLMELFLDDELPKKIKNMIKDRFQELEEKPDYPTRGVTTSGYLTHSNNPVVETVVAQQSPSMQRLMQQNPDLIPKPPQPVTPAAAEALARRQALLNSAGKEEKGSTRPRKI